MAELIEYKCPCCGGAISFDSSIQKMKCPYCDTEFEMETLKELDDELKNEGKDSLNWGSAEGSEWKEGEEEGMRLYVCESCGGEILTEDTTAATVCPFCDNPVVMKEQVGGMLRPDCVIPFKLDKEDAKKGFLKHLSGKRLLPKIFKDETHIDEIKGIYVPFWLFDSDADANIRYKATRIHCWSDSNYNYTKTSFYSVIRHGTLSFDQIPVDGSEKMADDLMESLEPFNFNEAVDFQTAYLAGYLADKYDVTSEKCSERANQRAKNSTAETFRNTVQGYASVTAENVNIRLSAAKTRYALFPVWLMNTTYKGQKYVFAMNGQTGKFVGNLPMDKGAFAKWFFGIFGGVAAAVLAVTYLLWLL